MKLTLCLMMIIGTISSGSLARAESALQLPIDLEVYDLFAHPRPAKTQDGSLVFPPETVPVLKYILQHYHEMPGLSRERDARRDAVWQQRLDGRKSLEEARLNRELARMTREYDDGFTLWEVVAIAGGSAAGAVVVAVVIAGLASL